MRAFRLVAAALLLLGPLLWSAPAEATFAKGSNLSRRGVHTEEPKVAVDPQGNAVIVWTRLDGLADQCGSIFAGKCRIQARTRSKDGTLGPILTLSDASEHALAPDVAIDKNGNAVVVWLRKDGLGECEGGFSDCYRVQARALKADGTLGLVRTLSVAGQSAIQLDVAMDPDGNAAVVWGRTQPMCGGSCYVIETRTLRANGTLTKNQRLSTFSQSPRVAMDANGNALFLWLRFDPQGKVQARTRSADGTLSEVQTLGNGNVVDPQLGLTPGGAAVFVWKEIDFMQSCDGSPCSFILARPRTAGGELGTTQTISGTVVQEPQVAVDADGDAVIVWTRLDGTLGCGGGQNACRRVEARARRADGTLRDIEVISEAGEHATRPQVAVDGPGNAVVLWERQFPTVGEQCVAGCFRIKARSRSAAGVWSPVELISAPNGSAFTPHVAVDPNGGKNASVADAIAVFSRSDASSPFCCVRTQAAAQIAP